MIHIILFEPEIPENTGNIARTCVAFDMTLHLIRPYGFIFDSKKVKRSGVDYWKDLKYYEYDSFKEFLEKNRPLNIYIYTRYGQRAPDDFIYNKEQDIFLMFGKESSGIPKDILNDYKDTLIRIPSSINVRSLNLSNVVAIASYEVVKQLKYSNLNLNEPHKKDFLE